VVDGERLQILGPLLGRRRVVLCCPRERIIENKDKLAVRPRRARMNLSCPMIMSTM
jgi:hypothetical protein